MAHTFDTNLRFTGSNSPLTQSYTCGSGATVLVLGIVTGGSVVRAGGAPTYNGVSLTQADSTRYYASSPETSCELWYLLAPPTGASYTISVPNTGAKSLYVQASSYKAASGYASVLDVVNGGTGLSADPSVSVTTEGIAAGWLGISSAHLDSFCGETGGYTLAEALDGTYAWYHSLSETHLFILDLGASYNVEKVRGRSNSSIEPTNINVYISTDGETWGAAVASDISTWQDTVEWVEIDSTDKIGRYVKVEITDTENESNEIIFGKPVASFSIFDVYGSFGGNVIVGVLGGGLDTAPTSQSGTSLNRTDNGTFSDSNQYKLQQAAGLWATNWICGSDDWCMCVAAFKEASSVQTVEVSALSLTLSLKTPVVAITGNLTVTITAQTLSLGLQAPSINIDNSQTVLTTALSLSLSLKAPTVIATRNPTVSISALSLSLALNNPSVLIGDDLSIIISAQTLSLSLKSPTVVIVCNPTILAPKFNLIATLKLPTYIVKDTVIAWATGHTQRITLKDNAVVDFNAPASAAFVKLVINNTGAWTVTWPDEVFIDSVVPTNKISSVLFDYDGANYYGIIE